MYHILTFVTIFFFNIKLLQAQNTEKKFNLAASYYSHENPSDSVKESAILLEEGIELLANAYWEKKENVGYKIQVFSGKSRWEANKLRSELISDYDNQIDASISYQAPNFKLRVGNFRDRLSATEYLIMLKKNYPGAFIVKDIIDIPKPKATNNN